jgi:imidazoleglycerol phosphate dehydratase HisB
MINELDDKLDLNFEDLQMDIRDHTKEASANIRHNLENALKKELVTRIEFEHELEQKADHGFYDAKISSKSDNSMPRFVIL